MWPNGIVKLIGKQILNKNIFSDIHSGDFSLSGVLHLESRHTLRLFMYEVYQHISSISSRELN